MGLLVLTVSVPVGLALIKTLRVGPSLADGWLL